MLLSAYSHVTYSSIPSVKLIQQPRQHMERLGPVLIVETPPRLCSSTHTSKTRHMYFCTKMHYAMPWIPRTVAHTKLLHAWTKPPNSPCMAVHHGIGSWGKISLYVAADHETVTIRPPPAWSAWTAVQAGIAHQPAPQTICYGHRICFQLTIRPEQPSLHGMMWKVPPCYIIDAIPAYKWSLSGQTLQLPSR